MNTSSSFINALLFSIVVVTTSFNYNSTYINTSYSFGGWSKLGKQVVSEGVHFDELIFSEEKKNIKKLKVKASKNSVYLSSIKILYKDGTSESHIISRRLEKGDSSRTFDLIGHYRIIQKIMFIYRGDSGRGGAQLIVLGKI